MPSHDDQIRAASELARAHELLRQGRPQEAEGVCRRALAATGEREPRAWSALGMILRAQNRPQEAEAAYRRALVLAPADVATHHNLGALLSQLERADEALAELDRAQSLGLQARELWINRGRTLAQLYRLEESEQSYARAVAIDPRSIDAQANLAQLRYMRGDADFARDISSAAARNRDDIGLQMAFGDLLRRAGDLSAAEGLLRDVIARKGPLPQTRAALATVLHEAGRIKEAELEALEAATARPQDPAIIETLVAIELALGRPDEALPFIRAQRARQPSEQRWIAYEATAARLKGGALYRELYDYERLVRAYDLEAPPGWRSMEELNAALVRALDARHHFVKHPLDQSLRHGSQTARSLLAEQDPAIRAIVAAFDAPLRRYCEAIGKDPGHPLSARNRAARAILAGCWSVRLHRDGFHVNHIHPQGWISSAYYVSVPNEVAAEEPKHGWIKFGEPRLPVPGAMPEHFVRPQPGRLVLFPSYMWHGTTPIHGDESRTTIAFDAVPPDGR